MLGFFLGNLKLVNGKLCGAVHGADSANMVVRVTPRFNVNYHVETRYGSVFIYLAYLYLYYLNVCYLSCDYDCTVSPVKLLVCHY